jgi:hypothetical protein
VPRYRIIFRIVAALLLFALGVWNLLLSISAVDRDQEKDLAVIQTKVRQYPWRAESWYILGSIRAFDMRYSSPADARRCLERALNLNPWNYKYWAALADFLTVAGEDAAARRCMAASLELNRAFTDLYWRAANFYVRRQDFENAGRCFRQALEGDPSLLRPVLATCWRAWPDRAAILREVIPSTTPMTLGALQWCLEMKDPALARLCWDRAIRSGEDFELQSSFGYIDFLIREGSPEEAHRVWQEAIAKSGAAPPGDDPNRVFNGSFEQPIFSGGFGWRLRTSPHLAVFETPDQRFHEYRSLKLVFDGEENWSGPILHQYVWLEERGVYRLGYALQSEGLSTDKGLYFEVRQAFPAGNPTALARGPEHLADSDWTLHSIPFTVSGNGTLLVFSLCRDSSRKIDSQIKGKAWLDDIRIEREAGP